MEVYYESCGITIINHPFGNGLHQLSMVIWGMAHYCYTDTVSMSMSMSINEYETLWHIVCVMIVFAIIITWYIDYWNIIVSLVRWCYGVSLPVNLKTEGRNPCSCNCRAWYHVCICLLSSDYLSCDCKPQKPQLQWLQGNKFWLQSSQKDFKRNVWFLFTFCACGILPMMSPAVSFD